MPQSLLPVSASSSPSAAAAAAVIKIAAEDSAVERHSTNQITSRPVFNDFLVLLPSIESTLKILSYNG